jgi:6-phosphogluconolactonase
VPNVLTALRGTLEVAADEEALSQRAADWLLAAVQGEGRKAVAISGGTTPRRMFALLSQDPRRSLLPWDRVHWFWVDERFIPPEDAASNYGTARRAFLDRAPVPEGNVHSIPTVGLSLDAAAEQYERRLQQFYGAADLDPARPLFDAVILGLGEDGHTASLFPGHAALAERRRWAVPVEGVRPEPRITLSVPVLGSSRATIVLVVGVAKRSALVRARAGDSRLPTSAIEPAGEWRWLADAAAAPIPEQVLRAQPVKGDDAQ